MARNGVALWDYPCMAIKWSPSKKARSFMLGWARLERIDAAEEICTRAAGPSSRSTPAKGNGCVRQRARSVLLSRNKPADGVEELRTARTLLGAIDIVVAGHSGRIVKNHGDGIDAAWFTPQRPIRGPRSSTG